jgi:hypothetical protein
MAALLLCNRHVAWRDLNPMEVHTWLDDGLDNELRQLTEDDECE